MVSFFLIILHTFLYIFPSIYIFKKYKQYYQTSPKKVTNYIPKVVGSTRERIHVSKDAEFSLCFSMFDVR